MRTIPALVCLESQTRFTTAHSPLNAEHLGHEFIVGSRRRHADSVVDLGLLYCG